MSIYNLSQDYKNVSMLLETIVESEEPKEVEEEARKILEIIQNQLVEKADNVAKYIKNEELEIQGIKEEEKRLKELRQSREKTLNRFKDYVLQSLIELDFVKVKTNIGNISIRKSKAIKVDIDTSELPREFIRTKTTIDADKKALKEAIEKGEKINGVELVENVNLNIR